MIQVIHDILDSLLKVSHASTQNDLQYVLNFDF